MRLPRSVVKLIRETANQERPNLYLQDEKLNPLGASSVSEIMILTYYRPSADFLHISSSNLAKHFLKGDEYFGKIAQLNSILRCKYVLAES